MSENGAENKNSAQKDYVRKLAELSARVKDMNDAEKIKYSAKIEELQKRIEALPPQWEKLYIEIFSEITGEDIRQIAISVQNMSDAAKAAYDDSIDPEEEEEYDPPKKRHGCLIAILILLVLMAAIAGSGYVWVKNEVNGSRGDEVVVQEIQIEKDSNATARTIAGMLKDAGIIRSSNLFYLYVREHEGVAESLQYGSFELTSDLSYDAIIEKLQQTNDDRETVRVTFPEGKTAIQYALIMEEKGLCSADEFLAVANKTGVFSEYSFWNQRDEDPNLFMTAEGYLFPDTYEFFVGDNVYNMVSKIYGEFDQKITPEMYARMDELDMTLSETITLASLIQEEAGNEHSKTVSAVFHNRLKKGMTLGSNVAWNKEKPDDNNYIYDSMAGKYGFGSWDAIPEEMREAYDTYTHQGLPAGPVSNPGLLAIEAALWPEENCEYYYFQTDTLGNYHFAKTNAEHEKITADLEKKGIRP